MFDHKKLYTSEDLRGTTELLKSEGKSIVLCFGHFNVIHPGHMRFLTFAKGQGDFLIVAVQSQEDLAVANQSVFFSQDERAAGVANLEVVDAVVKLDGPITDLIAKIGPDFYVKGREFFDKEFLIQDEISAVEEVGGKVLFSSGDVIYSTSNILTQNMEQMEHQKILSFLQKLDKYDISLPQLKEKIKSFNDLDVLVIGDTIVDQFVACDSLGISSEAPVQVIRELNSKKFIGGAAIVAAHLRSLGASCDFLSVVGSDESADFVEFALAEQGIEASLLKDSTRPTTFKIRYMVQNQKLLRVSRLKQHYLDKKYENELISWLNQLIPTKDAIVISDFQYGVVTDRIIHCIRELAKIHNVKVFGDTQCSSQVGDPSKLSGMTLITPTEKEARMAMNDQTSGLEQLARNLLQKTNNDALVITLGEQGHLVYGRDEKDSEKFFSEHFHALCSNPLDVAGAGDAMLSGFALAMTSSFSLMEASVIGAILSAVSVKRVGNTPVKPEELIEYIDHINNFRLNGLLA